MSLRGHPTGPGIPSVLGPTALPPKTEFQTPPSIPTTASNVTHPNMSSPPVCSRTLSFSQVLCLTKKPGQSSGGDLRPFTLPRLLFCPIVKPHSPLPPRCLPSLFAWRQPPVLSPLYSEEQRVSEAAVPLPPPSFPAFSLPASNPCSEQAGTCNTCDLTLLPQKHPVLFIATAPTFVPARPQERPGLGALAPRTHADINGARLPCPLPRVKSKLKFGLFLKPKATAFTRSQIRTARLHTFLAPCPL